MKLRTGFLIVLLLWAALVTPVRADDAQLLRRLFQKIKENDDLTQVFGYMQEAYMRDLDDEGKVTKEEKRQYRVIWLENEPYNELIQVDGKPLDKKHQEDERKRKAKFIKAVREKKPEYKLGWKDLFEKYDYTIHPPSGGAAYVITFKPKKSDLDERTRGEKIINNLTGTVWVDSDMNILKGIATIQREVKFGLGILGSLDELNIEYAQQPHEGVWLPRSLKMTYRYRILIKGKRQQYQSRFYDIYRRPGSEQVSEPKD